MAMPFQGKKFTFTQPNGEQLEVIGSGDQHQAFFTTLDGNPVVENPITRFYELATVAATRSLMPSGVVAGHGAQAAAFAGTFTPAEQKALALSNGGLPRGITRWRVRMERKRSPQVRGAGDGLLPAPPQRGTVGTFRGLCLLIEFPDQRATMPVEEVDAFLNQQGYHGFGNNGSVRDYFADISRNKVDYQSIAVPYYRAKHKRSYYTDESVAQPIRAQELILEALAHLRQTGFDFTKLSVDNEGYIYAINVYYAGPCVNNWAKGLWPHAHHLSSPVQVHPGYKAHDYQFTNMGDELELGTFCHENGHMLCDFPDLYDYGYESAGVGCYCLMCGGGNADPKNPTHVNGYLKYRAGWADSVSFITQPGTIEVTDTGNHFHIYRRTDSEYFLLEYRANRLRDAGLPGTGLAIWHVDERGNNSYEQATPTHHYECTLIQADGHHDLEANRNAGDPGDLYPAAQNDRFDPSSNPSSRWWDGNDSGLRLENIRRTAGGVFMRIG